MINLMLGLDSLLDTDWLHGGAFWDSSGIARRIVSELCAIHTSNALLYSRGSGSGRDSSVISQGRVIGLANAI